MRFSSARLEQKVLLLGQRAPEMGPVVQGTAFPRMPLYELFRMLVSNKLRAAALVVVAELSVVEMIATPEFVEVVATGPGLVEAVVRHGLVEEVG